MILILLGSQPRVVLPVLQAAHDLDVAGCILVGTAATPGLRWSALCHGYVRADFDDPGSVARQLRELAQEHPGAVLVPCDCPAIRLLQALGPRLPLPSTPMPTPAALEVLDDKWKFHQLCVEQGLPVPSTVHVPDKHALSHGDLVAALGLPYVVKPANASGSLGVVVVHDRHELDRRIVGDPAYVDGALVVQRYVDGPDIDVDLLAIDGQLRALTSHRVAGCWMEFMRHPALEAMAARLCRATAYSGPMNLDARIDRATGQVLLIESNPRFWASLAAPLACGLNFLAEALPGAPAHLVEPRRPTAVRCNRRHPLLRPAEWWRAVADGGPQGRLVRAVLLDPYALGELVAEVPAMASRRLQRIAAAVRARGPGAAARPTVQP